MGAARVTPAAWFSTPLARRTSRPLVALLGALAILGSEAGAAAAAGPPVLGVPWASEVLSGSARLHAAINPNEAATNYHVDYIPEAAYQANLGQGLDGFAAAERSPAVGETPIGSGATPVAVARSLSGLDPDTPYRYRFVAQNISGGVTGPVGGFTTFPRAASGPDPCPNAVAREQTGAKNAGLPDCRAYEMVSPVHKNGGEVDPPGALRGGGVLQAAAAGGAVTYGSAASFGAEALGAPGASQYIARRRAGGWSSENITVPLFSGSFGTGSEGVPYRLFSGDLVRGLLLNGRHCRGGGTGCPVANPPLVGTDAPAGYQNYYLRASTPGSFEALLGAADVAGLAVDPADLELSFAGASPDLRHVVLSSCSALTPGATDGCGAGEANLYMWSGGALGGPINAAPGAALAAPLGAVSADGTRVYWVDLTSGDLHLSDAGVIKQVDAAAGGGGTFETAAADGSPAFYTKAGHLYRYDAAADTSADLTPAGAVAGVLGASADGTRVYYQDASGLKLWHSGAITTLAPGAADPGSYPPATGSARVSADGNHLLFVSEQSLTGHDNTDLLTGTPTGQVYLYEDAGAGQLTCVSCNPTNRRPSGPSTVPGAIANGTGLETTWVHKPRVLLPGGRRVYFESRDALVLTDTNNDTDVYQWQAQGNGSCARPGGCIALISSGRAAEGDRFVDASEDGTDVFFLTESSLASGDPGSLDLYDARLGGGFAQPPTSIPCIGDSCQVLPPDPVDPTLTTLLKGLGNPPARYVGERKRCRKGSVRRKGKCVKRRTQRAKKARHGKHRRKESRR